MVAFLITGAIAGLLLGLRFRIFVLVPTVVIATLVIIVSGSGHKLSVIILTVVGTAVSLQIGYIVGAILRGWLPYRPGPTMHISPPNDGHLAA